MKTLTTEKMFPSGGWLVSAMVNGYYCKCRYLGYTKKEAVAEFKNSFINKGATL